MVIGGFVNKYLEGKGSMNNCMAQEMANFCITMSNQCLKMIQEELKRGHSTGREVNRCKQQEMSSSLSSQKQEERKPVKRARKGLTVAEKPQKPQFISQRPKAPASSYLIFLHENKAAIALKHKLTSVTEVAKASSTEWKSLSTEQRDKYVHLASFQKKRYYAQLEAYKEKYRAQLSEYKLKKQAYYRSQMREKKEQSKAKEEKERKNLMETLKEQFDSDSVLSSEHAARPQ